MGSVISAIAGLIGAVVNGIANFIMGIVSGIAYVFIAIFDVIFDILCCRCGSRSRRRRTTSSGTYRTSRTSGRRWGSRRY
ncbi:hypothetical protein BS47DRAFT_1349470 [Hydnum rufescens UP504]|uniref:Uncharacterized protein n=1 Tax=Hydnum rufescens UP504 TaxID=1448309 RepID=A0A9P6DT26_9AGAM|nr:hypothetical protein BS47DRAFT_1349470 [Hydnum rufescens UP504]